MNILVNPTGCPDHFHALDWVIEHNNLYIKRIHGGQYSNQTVDQIVKESPLIKAYKNICRQFEDMFCLDHKTSWHSPADMKGTFAKLSEYMRKERSNEFIPGRTAKHEVQDMMAEGMKKALAGMVDMSGTDNSEDIEGLEIEVEDDGSLDL